MAQEQTSPITVAFEVDFHELHSLPAHCPLTSITVTLTEDGNTEISGFDGNEAIASFIIAPEVMDEIATKWWRLRYPELLVFLLKLHTQPDVNGHIEYTMVLPHAEVEGHQLITPGNGSSAQQVITAFYQMALVASQQVMAE